jgi:hypothetical protein
MVLAVISASYVAWAEPEANPGSNASFRDVAPVIAAARLNPGYEQRPLTPTLSPHAGRGSTSAR